MKLKNAQTKTGLCHTCEKNRKALGVIQGNILKILSVEWQTVYRTKVGNWFCKEHFLMNNQGAEAIIKDKL